MSAIRLRSMFKKLLDSKLLDSKLLDSNRHCKKVLNISSLIPSSQHEMKPLEAWVDVARKRVDQIEVDGDLPKLQKIIADVNVSTEY